MEINEEDHQMATIKIYLPTFRRNELLRRSVESLLCQTYTDWICEVHNDDPDDVYPPYYIESLKDSRFKMVHHNVNLGPVNTFNLIFEPTDCKYICLLEDDNWWEPAFLETTYNALQDNKNVQVAFTNMYLWQEGPENQWTNTNKTIWPMTDEGITFFKFPSYQQSFTAIHSNGAMLIRNIDLQDLKTPNNILFDFVEPIRERAFKHPLLLINRPLANFSLTIQTGRSKNISGRYEHYLLLFDSFFKEIKMDDECARILWKSARDSKYRSYLKLIYAGFVCKSCRKLLKYISIKEWANFLLYNIKHPTVLMHCFNAKTNYAELSEYLRINTFKRIEELKDK